MPRPEVRSTVFVPSPSGTSSAPGAMQLIYAVQFEGASPGNTVSLEVTFNRARSFEFLIDPKEVKRQ